MNFDEFKTKYRAYPRKKRLLILAFVFILLPVLLSLDLASSLVEQKEESFQDRNVQKNLNNKARDKKRKLPMMEEKLVGVEKEMFEISKLLPSELNIDIALQKTNRIARKLYLSIHSFDPGLPAIVGDAFKYVEQPIKVKIKSSYTQVMLFFDALLHQDLLVNVRNIEMMVSKIDAFEYKSKKTTIKHLGEEKELMARENTNIEASFDLIVFRSLTNAENESLKPKVKPKKKRFKKR